MTTSRPERRRRAIIPGVTPPAERPGAVPPPGRAVGGRWAALVLASRIIAVVMALGLLLIDGFSDRDAVLGIAGLAWAAVSTAALLQARALRGRLAFWLADAGVVLALVLASGDWRSPFYLLWLTTLAAPAVHLRLRTATAAGAAAALAFLGVAFLGGPEPGTLGPTSSETLAIHLALPLLLVVALAFAADVLRRLERTQREAATLALTAERRRIAVELHDSAKQRVHVAHLLLTALLDRLDESERELGTQAIVELEGATAELDTTVAGLHSPLAGRTLEQALRERAAQLDAAGGPTVAVEGRAGPLSEPLATHAFRVGVEAMTNAVRHARAEHVRAVVASYPDRFCLDVVDDGCGMSADGTAGGSGIRAMHTRAATLGGRLRVGPGPGGRGTAVRLEIPRGAGGAAG